MFSNRFAALSIEVPPSHDTGYVLENDECGISNDAIDRDPPNPPPRLPGPRYTTPHLLALHASPLVSSLQLSINARIRASERPDVLIENQSTLFANERMPGETPPPGRLVYAWETHETSGVMGAPSRGVTNTRTPNHRERGSTTATPLRRARKPAPLNLSLTSASIDLNSRASPTTSTSSALSWVPRRFSFIDNGTDWTSATGSASATGSSSGSATGYPASASATTPDTSRAGSPPVFSNPWDSTNPRTTKHLADETLLNVQDPGTLIPRRSSGLPMSPISPPTIAFAHPPRTRTRGALGSGYALGAGHARGEGRILGAGRARGEGHALGGGQPRGGGHVRRGGQARGGGYTLGAGHVRGTPNLRGRGRGRGKARGGAISYSTRLLPVLRNSIAGFESSAVGNTEFTSVETRGLSIGAGDGGSIGVGVETTASTSVETRESTGVETRESTRITKEEEAGDGFTTVEPRRRSYSQPRVSSSSTPRRGSVLTSRGGFGRYTGHSQDLTRSPRPSQDIPRYTEHPQDLPRYTGPREPCTTRWAVSYLPLLPPPTPGPRSSASGDGREEGMSANTTRSANTNRSASMNKYAPLGSKTIRYTFQPSWIQK
ncbi:hypothetical protein CC1G_07438 [Coprinopsis cinerea okayama7|uniref:Uncharacterized protein n=1 Tax=Coprinopsis cinerea (strain Okayama-7 / 130 / ATCC MYA-4618 / FGSC 9003) TaxID=240176 RepID=A8NB66_COPC7|nr:hypothetical protein CC1G_07438 [Coprinopsis cinerea okayama7\|eukprot:XP_001832067.2 hypothetical protein CC1G_07438 [Coprinopsis cinerea okayama7\